MHSFNYLLSTKIIFGCGKLDVLAEECKSFGKKALIVCGKNSVKQNGILERIAINLQSSNIAYKVFDGIEPEPEVEIVDQIISVGKEANVDMVIGVGGGSALDTAKAAAVLIDYDEAAENYFGSGNQKLVRPGKAFIAIPTTSGTGSEVTNNSVLKNKKTGLKTSLASPVMSAKVAIVDPELTLNAPKHVTASSGMDALTHAVESYISNGANSITKALAYKAAELIFCSLEDCCNNPQNLQSRSNMAMGSLMAGMAFSNSGLGISHAISHPLGYMFNVAHGVANALLLSYALEFNKSNAINEIAELYSCLNTKSDDLTTEERAEAVIEKVRGLTINLGLPGKLSQLGVNREAFKQIAEQSFSSRSIKYNRRKASVEDIVELLERAY